MGKLWYQCIGLVGGALDENEVKKQLVDYVQHVPMAARGLGVRLENNVPNRDDVARTAKDRLFVKIKI